MSQYLSYALLYVLIVVGLASGSAALLWHRKVSMRTLSQSAGVLLAIVVPGSILVVLSGDAIVALIGIVLVEEIARAFIVFRVIRDRGAIEISLLTATIFALLETTNWIFIPKAASALSGLNMTSPQYYLIDAAYIGFEFASGFIVHFALTLLMVRFSGSRDPSLEQILPAMILTFIPHLALNYMVRGGA